jgi:hypothetical protein
MAIITSNASGAWATGATWVGGVVPADGDSVVIAAAHNVLMNADLSAFTGLLSVTISGHATTPGMLYFTAGSSGYLKIRTGYTLLGTTGTLKGRLLANSDGVWGNTGVLPFADKAVIDLGATSLIDAQYLDIALRCYNSMAHPYLRTYGVRHIVTGSAAADTLTKTAHGLTNTTPVMIMSSLTVPTGLVEDFVYYVVNATANTFQLAATSGGTVIDLTSDGTGTIEVYTGAPNGATPVNVFEDVTAETGWVTTAGHNSVVVCNAGPQNYDQQRLTITTLAASTITLSAALDSIQYPGARIYLMSRNCSIRSACVSAVNIVNYGSATTSGGVFGEIRSTAGAGTTFYGNGTNYGTGHTITTISGCSTGISYGTGHTVTTISGCTNTFGFGVGNVSALSIVLRGANIPSTPTFVNRNTVGVGSQGKQGVFSEDHGRVLGASYAFLPTGDVIKNTTIVRAGGAASSLEVVPLSNCSVLGYMLIFEWTELSVPASAQNKSVYIRADAAWSVYPTAAELYIEAEYISNGTTFARTIATSTAVLSDGSTWVQFAIPAFTPAAAGHVRYRAYLKKYEATRKIYVDNMLVTT